MDDTRPHIWSLTRVLWSCKPWIMVSCTAGLYIYSKSLAKKKLHKCSCPSCLFGPICKVKSYGPCFILKSSQSRCFRWCPSQTSIPIYTNVAVVGVDVSGSFLFTMVWEGKPPDVMKRYMVILDLVNHLCSCFAMYEKLLCFLIRSSGVFLACEWFETERARSYLYKCVHIHTAYTSEMCSICTCAVSSSCATISVLDRYTERNQ